MSNEFPRQIARLITEDPDIINEAYNRRGWDYEKQLDAEELEDKEILGDLMYFVKFTAVANFTEGEPMVRYYPDGSGYPGSPPELEWDIVSIDEAEAVDENGDDVQIDLTDDLKAKLKEALYKHVSDDDMWDNFDNDIAGRYERDDDEYDRYREEGY